jgi:CheY-like chemotaxis protein
MDARAILEDAGYRCHEADDGDAAIELLSAKAEQIMLLFSDVEMPGSIDGFELAREVSARWPWIDIVITSGRITPQPGDMPENATFISSDILQEASQRMQVILLTCRSKAFRHVDGNRITLA